MDEHEHNFCLLYAQPRIKEGILLGECSCGEIEEYDAQEFTEQAYKDRALYLFDFNSTPLESERLNDG